MSKSLLGFNYLYIFLSKTPMPIVAIKTVFLAGTFFGGIPMFNVLQNLDAPILSFYAMSTILSLASIVSDTLLDHFNLY